MTLLVLCRVMRPHVADQSPQGFHSHVTNLQGPNNKILIALQQVFESRKHTLFNILQQEWVSFYQSQSLTDGILSFQQLSVAGCWKSRAAALLLLDEFDLFGQRFLPPHSSPTRAGPIRPLTVLAVHVFTLVLYNLTKVRGTCDEMHRKIQSPYFSSLLRFYSV